MTIGHVAYYASRGDGSFAAPEPVARPENADADVVVTVADGNGNGSADVVWSSPRGMWLLDLAGTTSAGMLVTIHNGLGQTTRFTYASSATLAVQAAGAGQAWTRTLPVSIPVPVESTVTVAGTAPRVVQWGVCDGFWDGVERRFGGFLETRKVVPGDTARNSIVTTTTHHSGIGNERILRGQPLTSRIENGVGDVLSVTTTQWVAHRIDSLPDHPLLRLPIAQSTRTSHHEGVATPIVTVSSLVVDGEARTFREYDSGRLDVVGDESLVVRRYASNDQLWIRDRLCSAEVYAIDGTTLLSATRTYFGAPSGAVQPLCVVGDGLERRTESWLGEENRWVESSSTAYDSHHNAVETRSGGIRRTFTYDPAGLHVVAETMAPSSDRTLTYRATWDDVLDLPVSTIDPGDTETRVTYDAMGRLETVALGDRPPHLHYQYDWAAPRAVTRSFSFDGADDDLGAFPGGFIAGRGWRETVIVANGVGETLFTALRLADARWIVSGWKERDARGRVVAVSDPFYWNGSDPRAISPEGVQLVQRMRYDGLDRLVEQTAANGSHRQWTYRAFGSTVGSDELAAVTTVRDGKQRIIRTERTVAGITESVDATYDPAGRLSTMRLQAGGPEEITHRYVYDTLGRLTFATDPDVGERHMLYDDDGRLIEQTNGAGQTTEFAYDLIGRLTSVRTDGSASYTYHYDVARTPETFERTAGRLAWVEEKTGQVEIGYDIAGRQAHMRRTILGETAEEVTTLSVGGSPLKIDYRDGFSFDIGYDDAGRAIRVGQLWFLDEQDASGRVLREHYGNGLTQAYERDVIGQPSRIQIRHAEGAALYDARIEHNTFGAPTSVDDLDGARLNHTATFTYDSAARLLDTSLGRGDERHAFSYRYDSLQNMIHRSQVGPHALGALTGRYVYGEADAAGARRGPRQLTSVVSDDGTVTRFDYNEAGRQIRQGDLTLEYNAADQLLRVRGLATGDGVVEHTYGYDGLRVVTRGPDGKRQLWFYQGLSQDDGVRDHYVRLGTRLIARVTMSWVGPAGGATPTLAVTAASGTRGARLTLLLAGVLFVLAVLVRGGARRRRGVPTLAAVTCVAVVLAGCSFLGSGGSEAPLWSQSQTLYYHHAIGAGPSLITTETGAVFEERRYEPFGDEVDAFRDGAGTGDVDFARDPNNFLNKPSDPATGWSYHGARWMAPETGRWLTPDPPTKAPDDRYLAEPWSLHPYQYGQQSPTIFWDPDGCDLATYNKAQHSEETATASSDELARTGRSPPTPRASRPRCRR